MKIEHAWLVYRFKDIKEALEHGKSFTRLYFGHHFCQYLLPEAEDIRLAYELAADRGWGFTLVVPVVTDSRLDQVRKALDMIEDLSPEAEVVANDWGVLMLMQGRRLTPIAGRTFSKGKRDPRLLAIFNDLPASLGDYYRQTNVTDRSWTDFLRRFGVARLEVDVPPWRLDASRLSTSQLPISFYVNYIYLATALNCPIQVPDEYWERSGCGKPCTHVHLGVGYPGLDFQIQVIGNTYYLHTDSNPMGDVFAKIPGSRLVFDGGAYIATH